MSEKEVQISFVISESLLKKLDALADREKRSRQQEFLVIVEHATIEAST